MRNKRAGKKRAPTGKGTERTYTARMYTNVMRAPAMLAKDQVKAHEDIAIRRDWVRRAMWNFLAMPGKEVIQSAHKDRATAVAYAGLLVAARDYRGNLRDIGNFVSIMEARLVVALACRADMEEVIAEAKANGNMGKRSASEGATARAA